MIVAVTCLLFSATVLAEPPELVQAFLTQCRTLAVKAEADNRIAVRGGNGFWFLTAELRHMGAGQFWGPGAATASRARKPEYSDPMPAIVDFKQQLDATGIELLLVPVPAKVAIYNDKLFDSEPPNRDGPSLRVDFYDRKFLDLLIQQGIGVIDLWPELIKLRETKQAPAYCRQDSHWAGPALARTAELIAAEIADRLWAKKLRRKKFESDTRDVRIRGDLVRNVKDATLETLTLQFVGFRSDAGLTPVDSDPKSPIVLLGDSHCLVFHSGGDLHARGAGLADQLALELGFPVDVVAVRGSGATSSRINLLRRSRRDPAYLQRKKLIVWCFSTREYTESSGWRRVPISPANRSGG